VSSRAVLIRLDRLKWTLWCSVCRVLLGIPSILITQRCPSGLETFPILLLGQDSWAKSIGHGSIATDGVKLGGLCGRKVCKKGESLLGKDLNLPPDSIQVARSCILVGWRWRYLNIASKFHRPIIWTSRGLTLIQRIIIAPSAQSAWAEMMLGSRPSLGMLQQVRPKAWQ
jgi:hypothetical protein